MAVLRGKLAVSGHGTPVPLRVETPDGNLVALMTAERDGSWEVDVPPGTYTVHPRWLPTFEAETDFEQPHADTDHSADSGYEAARASLREQMVRRHNASEPQSAVPDVVAASTERIAELMRRRRGDG